MPFFKKAAGVYFGVEFNAKEKAIIDEVLRKQFMEMNEKNFHEVDAVIIYILHNRLGISKKKLHDFYLAFREEFRAMQERYELEKSENLWLYTNLLKDQGIDIDAWAKEVSESESEG